ncbi:MAG: RNA-binding protein [Rhodospirillales bacterium]|nr:RNA-binding protein [Rhodospirillales bacterium]
MAGPRAKKDGAGSETAFRTCIVTGVQKPKDQLLRFVVGPDGDLVPDLDERLPGRGLWLSGERDMVNTACGKGLFARAARQKVGLPEDLAGRVDSLIVRRCLDLIGLARRAGEVVAGFEKTKARLREGRGGVLLEASDGAADGRGKIRALAPDLAVVDLFSAEDLGRALGRDNAVHGVIDRGRLADRLMRESDRLMAFRGSTG